MQKLGRNDFCRCGSNLKYKKCCLRKDEQAEFISAHSFKSVDPIDIFSTIAALSLIPDNLGKGITLDKALVVMANVTPEGSDLTDINVFLNWLNESKEFDDAKRLEDPPEGLFTENLCYHGGNYILFPGVQDNPTFILNHLLAALDLAKNIPKEYLGSIFSHARFLLEISTRIAESVGHQRWMPYPDPESLLIGIDSKLLPLYKNAVIFSEDEIKALCEEVDLSLAEAHTFIIESSSARLRGAYNFHDNAFHSKPILKIGDVYIVVHLPGIISALRHFILTSAKQLGLLENVARAYKSVMSNKIFEALHLLDFKYLQDIAELKEDSVEGQIYRFDVDKICVVIHTWDDCDEYNEHTPFGHENSKKKVQAIEDKGTIAVEKIRQNPIYANNKIFLMLVTSGLGRDSVLAFKKLPYYDHYIGISSADLVTLGFQRDHEIDAIFLWNYATAEYEIEKKGVVVRMFSLLDGLSFFLEKKESFYLSDNEFYGFIAVPTDGGRPMRERARKVNDFHNVALPDGKHLGEVTRLSGEDAEVPIYVPLERLGSILMMVVEGYSIPIWVMPTEIRKEYLRSDYFVFCDAVAYWIWQLTDEVGHLVAPLYGKPVSLFFEISTYVEGQNIEVSWASSPNDDRTFKLSIPSSLNQDDHEKNEGERKIVKALVEIFCAMGEQFGAEFSHQEIDNIVNRVAPHGVKKKINHISMDHKPEQFHGNLPREPQLREFYIGRNLDDLGKEVVSRLNDPMASVDPIPADRRKDLLDSIKLIYKDRMLSKIAPFDRMKLLSKVIELHESVVKRRAFISDTTASSVACYSTISEKAEYLKTEFASLTSLAIGLRFLVEFIMATQWKGHRQEIPNAEIEDILATSYGFVSWGMIGEEIRCRVVDHQFAILKSGRVGMDGSLRSGFEEYFSAKVFEEVEIQVKGWSKNYSNFSNLKRDEFYKAFEQEFKISLNKFKDILSILVGQAFSRPENTLIFSIGDLRKIVCVEGTSEGDLDRFINILGMQERAQWDAVPVGYSMNDIEPWKFARKLSFMHKPLLVLSNNYIMYGPRHLSTAVRHFINSSMSGEIRSEYFSSEEMQQYIGSQIEEKGFEFERVFSELARSSDVFDIETSVGIGPTGIFDHEEDLGDVDVILFDQDKKLAILVECKEIDPGRTAVEIGAEIDRLILDKPKKPSRMTMHMKRHDWFCKNWRKIEEKYNLPLGAWKIQSVFLTSEEIPAPRLKDLKLPLYSYTELLRDGVEVLGTRQNQYEFEIKI